MSATAAGLAGVMFEELFAASDDVLLSVLAEADDQDEIAAERWSRCSPPDKPIREESLEVVILGALGCRLGMLNGEAGGILLRIAGTCLLIDPGPAAVYLLSRLERLGHFRFCDLDAILCSHIHTDHITDLLPCIEGMTRGMRVERGCVISNQTVMEKFLAFSPYHLAKVRPVVLAPGIGREKEEATQEGGSRSSLTSVKLGGIEVWATPTFHLEEAGKWDTGIGFLIQSQKASLWYTSDTNLFDGLLQYVEAMACERLTLVIANADASDVERKPGKAQVCHLLTRDVPEIARRVRPRHILIQHYDEAYSSPRYRLAQAIYLQRLVDRSDLETRILPSANGLSLSFDGICLREHDLCFESDAGIAVRDYLEALRCP